MTTAEKRERDRILLLLQEAFADTEMPGDADIVSGPAPNYTYFTNAPDDEMDAYRVFRGRLWNEVDLPDLRRDPTIYYFLSPTARSYYLPTLLRLEIIYRDESPVVWDLLSPPPSDGEQFAQQFQTLTPLQIAAVKEVVNYLLTTPSYYSRFPEEEPRRERLLDFWLKNGWQRFTHAATEASAGREQGKESDDS